MKKNKIVAILLNIFIGAGYIYLGQFQKAFLLQFILIFVMLAGYFIETYIDFSIPIAMLLYILIYLYSFIDILKSDPLQNSESLKYSKWYFIVIYIILSYTFYYIISKYTFMLPSKHFILHSSSMNNTLFKGDFIVALKKDTIKRGDLIVFKNPLELNNYYTKRVVALDGDELIYMNKKILIHFTKEDSYIKKHYPSSCIYTIDGKLWVLNPYKINNSNIIYKNNSFNLFTYVANKTDAMSKIYIKEFAKEEVHTDTLDKKYNALYTKVKKNRYFVLGDNREESIDSLIFGAVPKSYIYGTIKRVYFNFNNWNRFNLKVK